MGYLPEPVEYCGQVSAEWHRTAWASDKHEAVSHRVKRSFPMSDELADKLIKGRGQRRVCGCR